MPGKIAFLFAHGAGAGSAHPWMRHWAQLLNQIGPVFTFDYPYMARGGGRPDSPLVLLQSHRAALQRVRQSHPGPIALIGKSMGGRIGCHLALQEPVAAIICLGYPLCGAGDCTKLRDQVLLQLTTPILFVQGARDPLCPLETLEQVRTQMRAKNALHVVPGGDHSLLVTKTQLKADGQTQESVDQRILLAVREFVQ